MRKRRDTNQSEIVAALEQIGATVVDLADVGGGCPDILVGYRGRNFLIEIKSPSGKLKKSQMHFLNIWRGHVEVAKSIGDAFEIIGAQIVL